MLYSRAEIKANREKWVAFLQEPERKKATGKLSKGDTEHRCCLGHACQVLDPEKTTNWVSTMGLPPQEIVDMLGLVSDDGVAYTIDRSPGKIVNTSHRSLTTINDGTKMRPQAIGEMLAGMIEGGPGTPFFPLTDYPE